MKRLLLLIAVISLIVPALAGTSVKLSDRDNSINVIASGESETILQYRVSHFDTKRVSIDGNEWFHIELPGEGITQDKGLPQLPVWNRSIIIGNTSLMKLEVYDVEYSDVPMPVAPSKGVITRDVDPATVAYTFDKIYQGKDFYPADIAQLSQPYVMRDFRGITVQTVPFAYNPDTRMLRVYTAYKIRVFADGIDMLNTLPASRTMISRAFLPIYENHFLNYQSFRYVPVSDSFGKLLVICHTNYMSTILPWVNWKKQKGIETELVQWSTIGTTATQLQTYIQNRYNADNTLAYVQIVGDAPQIPSLSSGGGGSDPSFSLVAGGDNYPDIFIGRFSAETTAQVTAQINKAIAYERDLTTTATWLSRGMGIASSEGGGSQGDNGESDIQHMNNIRTDLLGYGYTSVDQIYDPGALASTVTTNVNAGRGFINYVGHGSNTSWSTTGFSNTNASALTNGNMTPVIMDVACVNGNFVSITCFAEAWLRNANGGAVAMYASTINQSWNSPMRAQDEFTDLMTTEQKFTTGGLYYNSSCKMMDIYGNTSGSDGVNMFKTWTIFGDASLLMRSKTPLAMTVSHPATIVVGASTVNVSTGVANTLVALSYNNTIYARGYTDVGGNATLTLVNAPQTALDYVLTATAFNRVTYIGTLQQVPGTGPFMVVNATVYADADNNVAEYNEAGAFSVTFQNIGAETVSNLNATLTCSTTGITITDNSESIASIAAGASVTRSNAYTFNIANNVAHGTTAQFTITMVSGAYTWVHNFSLELNAPVLAFGSMIISDPAPGNNNGRIDPGETVTITMPLGNNGGAASLSGSATLVSPTTGISISGSPASFGFIPAGGSQNLSFNVSAASGITVGTNAVFNFNATAGAYSATKTENTAIGLIIEDFESGNFNSFPWTFSGNLPWTITNSGAYAGTYAAKSGVITHSQTSTMQTVRVLSSAGSVSFWYKVSSESGYDYLRFYIDGVLQNQWAGEVPWTQATYNLNAGTRTLAWTYYKDGSVSTASDCAWVDNIIFPASTAPSVYNPPQNLSAVPSHQSVKLDWQAPSSGSPTGYKIFKNSTLLTTLTALTYTDTAVTNGTSYAYYLTAVYSGGESDPTATVNATPNTIAPTNLAANAGNGVVNLTWTGATGREGLEIISTSDRAISGYKVYRNSTLLTTVTGTTYADNAVVNETTYSYYVTTVYSNPAGESAASNTVQAMPTAQTPTTAILGTGTTATGTSEGAPINIWYKSLHGQSVYTAAELNAAGIFGPINITQIGFYISSVPTLALPNFNIRMKHTAEANVANWQTATDMVTVYTNASYMPTAGGFEMLTLSTPFLWNGTGNIVVDTAFDMVSAYSSTGTVQYTSVTNGYRYVRNDNANQSGIFTGGTVSVYRPNLKFTFLAQTTTEPMIAVNPSSISETVNTGASVNRNLTISNTGSATLNWSIQGRSIIMSAENAAQNTKSITDLRPEPWLSISPLSGTIAAGGNTVLAATLNSAGLADGTFNDTIVISSNAANEPELNVPVTFTVFNPYPVEPRFVAEWEPAKGALIRYPFGQPYGLIADMSNNGLLYVIVTSASQSTCNSALSSNGVNMANVRYLNASSDSYWTRDYGPWTIFDANNQMKIVDFTYNRPRPNDNLIPSFIANNLGLQYYTLPLNHTGGNIMTDGMGKAMSSQLVLSENSSYTQNQINQLFQDYLGVTEYQLYVDPLANSSIDHIDCWAKLLDVDKVIIAQVPIGHSNYSAIEAGVAAWQTKTSSYGTPYRIFRAYAPNNEPYTNSYIMNKKIYVPQMGTANDAAALAVYQNAMPGYTIVGYSHSNYLSDDAIHCRVNTIYDDQMVALDHVPPTSATAGTDININVSVQHHNPLDPAFSFVAWRHSTLADWHYAPLTNSSGRNWSAAIPAPALGQSVYYWIKAQDIMGKNCSMPLCAGGDPFAILVDIPGANNAPEIDLPDSFTFDLDGQLTVDFSAFVSDVDNDPLSLAYSGNTHISVLVDGMSVSFSAPADWIGTETITFVVDDGMDNAQDSVPVTVNLTFLATPTIQVLESAGTVTVSWAAINHAQSYRIYACDSPNGTYTLIGSTNELFWNDASAQKRFYKVFASDQTR